jgi:erythronate-4-phosphate dehydrogenase
MNQKIKIAADNKIPFLKGVLEPYADIQYVSPAEMTTEALRDADGILIRTRTHCNESLLKGTNVKFIATATIGYDHIDTKYCNDAGIYWVNAPGCNSSSVQQYISSAILTIAKKNNLKLSETTIGIVGVGNVGKKVEKIARLFGMQVLLNDPPRAREEGPEKFVSLNELLSRSDIITLHVPLNKTGEDKTYHLADDAFFAKLNHKKLIINASRGPVVETAALKKALQQKIVDACVLDVWENEPNIDRELLALVDIATPHIAGYSADGKANGTSMSVAELRKFFKLPMPEGWYPDSIPPSLQQREITIDCENKTKQEILYEAVIASYNILSDDTTLRTSVETFEQQRGAYPIRREFPFYSVKLQNADNEIVDIISQLGFEIKH